MTTTPNAAVQQPSISKKNDLQPKLTVEMVPVQALNPAKQGVRKQSNRQIAKCRKSIQRYGVLGPALVSADSEIIDGHAMIEAARQLGLKEFPCIRVSHLNETEIRGLRIALNKIQETGEWDENALRLELAYQLEFNTDLTDLGFEPPELDNLFQLASDPPEEPDPADSEQTHRTADTGAITQDGDVWLLGQHMVACGNVRTPGLIEGLLGASKVDLIFTDPPFNVPINGHVRVDKGTYAEFAEASGEMSPSEFTCFLLSWLTSARDVLKPGGILFSFMDWRHMRELQDAISQAGLEVTNLCVWVKTNGGMGSFYRSRHELVFVMKKPGAPHTNNVQLGSNGRYRTNVWEYAGATGGQSDEEDDFSLHPTVKPIQLVSDALLDASAVGETVLDPFLGSGTTLLAAERTKRRCVGVEIAPEYVDVAVRRWQEMTGQEAVLQSTGETFSALAERRMSEKAPIDPQTTSDPTDADSAGNF